MKLHLPCKLLAAVLACFCLAASYTQAADVELPSTETVLTGDNLNTYTMPEGVGIIKVDDTATITSIGGAGTLTKTGDGTLVINSRTAGTTANLVVSEGILQVNYKADWGDGGHAFTQGDITVNGGATLLLNNGDVLGYQNSGLAESDMHCVGTLTLQGTENNIAKVQITSTATNNTSSANIALNGYTEISHADGASGKVIQTFGGTYSDGTEYGIMSATGTNNTVSVGLLIDKNLTVQVGALTGSTDSSELTLSGNITGSGSGRKITKTGLGTLIISTLAQDGNVSYEVNGGTLKVTAGNNGNGFTRQNVTINAGGTLLLTKKDSMGYNDNRIKTITMTGADDNLATLKLGGRQTMQTNIVMQGNALITAATAEETGSALPTGGDRPSLNPFNGGGISVSGTNNIIAVAIAERAALTINVAAEGSLSLTGGFYDQSESGIMTKTGAGLLTIDTSKLTADRTISHGLTLSEGSLATVGTLTITNLTTAAGTTLTNSGALTLAGTTALGAAIDNSSTGSITFASGAMLDMADMAYTLEGNKYVYTLTTTGSSISGLGVENLTNITTDGKTWDFSTLSSNGTFSYTINSNDITCSTDVTWTTGGSMGDSTFASGDNVTFAGTATATLGENIAASTVTIADGAEVTIAEGDTNSVLSADSITVGAGGSLALSGSAMLDTAHLNVQENGTLSMSGAELVAGTKVQGTGKLVLNIGDGNELTYANNNNGTANCIVNEFEGDLVVASGTYKHQLQGEWDNLNSLVVTGTGKALFFGTGTGGDFDGDIVVRDLTDGHKEALKLDGGYVSGTVSINCDTNIYNQWAGDMHSAINGEGQVTFTGKSTVTIGSNFSGLTGDVIVNKDGSADFTSNANIANTGKFIVQNGNTTVHSAITSTEGVQIYSGKTLNINGADQTNTFELNGGTIQMTSSTMHGSVVLGGDSVITGNDAGLKSAITGTGNLTLKGGNDNQLYVYSNATFTGNLEAASGKVTLGYDSQPKPTIQNTGDVNITGATVTMNNGAKISNSGNVNITSGSLTVNSGTSIANTNGAINVQGGNLVVKAGASMGTAAINVSSGQMKLDGVDALDNASVTISDGASLAINTGLSLEGVLTLDNGAKLDLTGFDLGQTTFAGNGTAVLSAAEGLSVGSIELAGTEGTSVIGLNADGNTLYVSELSSMGITDVTFYDADTQTLTFSTNLDVTHLFGDVTFELDGLSRGELGNKVYALVGDWSTMLNLSFTNTDGSTINLSGVTGLTLNDYSGESFSVSADGSSVGTYAAYMIPEPTTATLSLLALAGLAARRRRK